MFVFLGIRKREEEEEEEEEVSGVVRSNTTRSERVGREEDELDEEEEEDCMMRKLSRKGAIYAKRKKKGVWLLHEYKASTCKSITETKWTVGASLVKIQMVWIR